MRFVITLAVVAAIVLGTFWAGGFVLEVVADNLFDIVIKFFESVGHIIVFILFLPFEVVLNILLQALNTLPGVDIDYVDFTGDGDCSGAPGSSC